MTRPIVILLLTLSAACSSAPTSPPPDPTPLCDPTPVRVVEVVRADYTPEARRAGIEGVVTALVHVDATGTTTDLRVLDGPGHGLNENAAGAIWLWVFEPATENCTPVDSVLRIRHEFQLADETEPTPDPETTYICPMHPQIHHDEFGTCPTCRMDLISAP